MIAVSKRLQKVGPELIDELMLLTAQQFYNRWSQESMTSTYWRLNAPPKAKPLSHKLTVRSGGLRNALRPGQQIMEIKKVGDKWQITKGVYAASIPYANRQEKLNRGQRAFLEPSAKAMLRMLEEIKRAVLEKWGQGNG